ncbi:hypothetical protein TNCV_5087721 [Trichonephila clavipes]|nr:hypothetical protein TNCV_5087721 [Trichonephila clavipes]
MSSVDFRNGYKMREMSVDFTVPGQMKTASSLSRQLLCWHEYDSFKTNRAHTFGTYKSTAHICLLYVFLSRQYTCGLTGCGQPGEESIQCGHRKSGLVRCLTL